MKKRTKRILLVILGSFGVLGICLTAFTGYFFYSLENALNSGQYLHRPDAELIRNFQEHRSEFEQLRSMLERDDHIFRIDDDWTDPANLPKEQVEEYRRLFAIVETPRGFYNRHNPLRIEFISSSQGWVTSGSMKGYVYSSE